MKTTLMIVAVIEHDENLSIDDFVTPELLSNSEAKCMEIIKAEEYKEPEPQTKGDILQDMMNFLETHADEIAKAYNIPDGGYNLADTASTQEGDYELDSDGGGGAGELTAWISFYVGPDLIRILEDKATAGYNSFVHAFNKIISNNSTIYDFEIYTNVEDEEITFQISLPNDLG